MGVFSAVWIGVGLPTAQLPTTVGLGAQTELPPRSCPASPPAPPPSCEGGGGGGAPLASGRGPRRRPASLQAELRAGSQNRCLGAEKSHPSRAAAGAPAHVAADTEPAAKSAGRGPGPGPGPG